jgi:hypothetical protein
MEQPISRDRWDRTRIGEHRSLARSGPPNWPKTGVQSRRYGTHGALASVFSCCTLRFPSRRKADVFDATDPWPVRGYDLCGFAIRTLGYIGTGIEVTPELPCGHSVSQLL